MTDRTSDEHLELVTTFQMEPAFMRRSRLGTTLLKFTQLYRDGVVRAEYRRLVREIALASVLDKSSPPGG
jgi:hypothetical protein